MEKSKDGSPSITESALDMQDSGGLKVPAAAGFLPGSRKKVKSMADVRDRRHRGRKVKTSAGPKDGNVQSSCELARKDEVTLSSDCDLPDIAPSFPMSPQWKVSDRELSPTKNEEPPTEVENLYSIDLTAEDTVVPIIEEPCGGQNIAQAQVGALLSDGILASEETRCAGPPTVAKESADPLLVPNPTRTPSEGATPTPTPSEGAAADENGGKATAPTEGVEVATSILPTTGPTEGGGRGRLRR
jgi:hypothetical protein